MNALVPSDVGRVRFDPVRSLWLWGMLIPGVLVGIPSCTPRTIAASLLLAFLSLCVGHSVGLHRGVIHATYQTSPFFRGVLTYLFVLSGLGGPLSWARLHAVRDYWQNREDCPRYFSYRHSMLRDFFWNLHLRFEPADARCDARLPCGVLEERWLRFLEKTWPLHVLAFALAVDAIAGPGAVAVCVCARTAAGILGHWAVGYVAHRWGDRPFEIPGAAEAGTNVWILGVVSFGEGFHNNHHAHSGSARIGLSPHQFDLGWQVIRVCRALGLMRNVQTAGLTPRESSSPSSSDLPDRRAPLRRPATATAR